MSDRLDARVREELTDLFASCWDEMCDANPALVDWNQEARRARWDNSVWMFVDHEGDPVFRRSRSGNLTVTMDPAPFLGTEARPAMQGMILQTLVRRAEIDGIEAPTAPSAGRASPTTQGEHAEDGTDSGEGPQRFTIIPDDYHVPYAGTAEDGRRFFLSEELFDKGSAYVGLFLWNADGTFRDVRVDSVPRPEGLPPGQAGSSGAEDLVQARLAELGDYKLEPIEVEPFTEEVGGTTFGWRVGQDDDGIPYINIEPGDFIVYYEPWDGLEYDT